MPLTELDIISHHRTFSATNRNITKIVVLGDSGVGKTSLVNRFVSSSYEETYTMTIGGNFITKKFPIGDGKIEMLIFSDVAGQERFKDVRSVFYTGVEIVLAICDLTRKNTLKNLEKIWIPEFISFNTSKFFKPKIQLIGNKCDLEDLIVITSDDLMETACKLSIKYPQISMLTPCLRTSAKENLFLGSSSSSSKIPISNSIAV